MDLVAATVIRLLREQPFYASLVMNLERAPTDRARTLTPTACVFARRNGAIGLAVNEGFFGKLAPKEQEAVLVHECLHVVHLHLLRAADDFERRDLANIAMDLAINQYIRGLPAGALALNQFQDLALPPEETADLY